METLVINVPDDKSAEVKKFLKKLGVSVQNKAKVRQLANELNTMVKPGPKPGLDEIVAEVREARAGR
jgi:hypothetical protein